MQSYNSLAEAWLMEEFHAVEFEISNLCSLMQAAVILHLVLRKLRHTIFDFLKKNAASFLAFTVEVKVLISDFIRLRKLWCFLLHLSFILNV